MLDAPTIFTSEERDPIRSIAHNLQVSWKRESTVGNRTFTIGVSLIGGNDVVGINPGAVGSPSNYKYFDESDYTISLAWERRLPMPLGGMTKAFAEAELDNTSGRFIPRYMGGVSELSTAIEPNRPAIIGGGFNVDGVDLTIPQFTGRITKQPIVDKLNGVVKLSMEDYTGFFENKYVDYTEVFTGVTTDVVLENIFTNLGMSTAQFDLDPGINVIPFALLDTNIKYGEVISKLVQAENGRLYQDEMGIFRFENRQHWDNAPYNQVQRIISTAQVLNHYAPNEDNLINSVEVLSNYRVKQPIQPIMNFSSQEAIAPGATVELFFAYDDPVLQVITPTSSGTDSFYEFNTDPTGDGIDLTSQVSLTKIVNFSQASKITFTNSSSYNAYVSKLVISGRPAKRVGEIKYREQDSSSVTAYDEKPYQVDNEFISNPTWAQSLAKLILADHSDIENIQRIVIRAIPELQMGDLISWQGRYWRIFEKRTTLNTSVGYVDELTVVQRTVQSYFRIGISTIGGSDKIAP